MFANLEIDYQFFLQDHLFFFQSINIGIIGISLLHSIIIIIFTHIFLYIENAFIGGLILLSFNALSFIFFFDNFGLALLSDILILSEILY